MPLSGTAAQNWRSRISRWDSTIIPASRHLVFVRAQNLAEIFDLSIHAVEHLPHRIDLDLAAFESLQRKANRQMFGQLYKH